MSEFVSPRVRENTVLSHISFVTNNYIRDRLHSVARTTRALVTTGSAALTSKYNNCNDYIFIVIIMYTTLVFLKKLLWLYIVNGSIF